ncbi:MAG: EF-P beta-lysylation protein EpmB [Cellvibrionaceae bacterium]
MIPLTVPVWQSQTWQEQLINVVREPKQLCDMLDLDLPDFLNAHLAALNSQQNTEEYQTSTTDFPLRVPHSFIQRMKKGDMFDPLLLQVLPQAEELVSVDGYNTDPLEEEDSHKATGIIQKYHGRALIMVASACAIHCRYCFRRHFPYEDHRQSKSEWLTALDSIVKDPTIKEVIYSGGDPLAASDSHLQWLTEQVAQIAHVKTLRIHTRLPIVIPDRIDDACLNWLNQSRLKVVMVIHSNHSNEINTDVQSALQRLQKANVLLLNQSVLLKGVNDSADALCDLSYSLFSSGVLPYYLHVLDKVKGTHHFDLTADKALAIHETVKSRLPGYLTPKLSQEIPGKPYKVVLG